MRGSSDVKRTATIDWRRTVMKRELRLYTQLFRPLLVLSLLVSLVAGCAGASARQTREYVKAGTLPRPPVLLVHDFAVAPPDAPSSKEINQNRAVSRYFSEQVVAKLRERGIHAQRATASTTVPLHAIVVKGQFVTIDEGSRAKRMLIGFGAGSTELRARAQVYQMTESGLRLISEGEGGAHGSKMPGVAGPAAVAGATGQVAGVAIAGGMSVAREVKAELRPDVERLAEQFAERAVASYKRQGWR